MSMWKSDFHLALPNILVSHWTKFFLTSKFDSRLHGGSFFSHSVGSPLTTLQVCLSELEQINKNSELVDKNKMTQNYLACASLATKQISSLIEVAMARDPYEKVHKIKVGEFFNQLQTLYSFRGKSIKLIFSINLVSGRETIKMNKYFFFELMQCLLNNAIESYKKNARQKLVFITVVCKNRKLEIQVQDFGEGSTYLMTKVMASKGFTTKKSGHGFGLWFVKDVLEHHGQSKLKIFSSKDNGTTIRFSLPLF